MRPRSLALAEGKCARAAELAINLKTARALGHRSSDLARARMKCSTETPNPFIRTRPTTLRHRQWTRQVQMRTDGKIIDDMHGDDMPSVEAARDTAALAAAPPYQRSSPPYQRRG